jgi:hypothetical protein
MQTLSNAVRDRPAGTLAALGLVSGALSAAWGQSLEFEVLQPLALVFFLAPGALPIGFFYGAAIGLGMAAWARKPWAAIVLLATTIYAWSGQPPYAEVQCAVGAAVLLWGALVAYERREI